MKIANVTDGIAILIVTNEEFNIIRGSLATSSFYLEKHKCHKEANACIKLAEQMLEETGAK